MRLWTLHPNYLDCKGLIACWREGLLAKRVLEGYTRGYKNHPQLDRFKRHEDPLGALNTYLSYLFQESLERGYKFDKIKIDQPKLSPSPILTTRGQLVYEWQLLQLKLKTRDPRKYELNQQEQTIKFSPSFLIIEGDVEPWERVRSLTSLSFSTSGGST